MQSPETWPVVTINILSFNRRDEVRRTLAGLYRELDYPRERFEVIVVDNASSDGTKEMVRAEFPHVRLIVNDVNTGIAGWNRGFENGRGDYFLVLDDDSAPVSGLKEAIRFLQQNPGTGILACRIVGGPFTTGFLTHLQEWSGFIGCGAIIRKSVIEAVGGFADWLFLYTHEFEFGIRCLDRGIAIKYFADCVVHHRAAALNRSSRRLVSYSTRNELLIVNRYFASRRALFLFRTLVHNLLRQRREGFLSMAHVLEGFWMYMRHPVRGVRTYVGRAAQDRYVEGMGTAQPLPTVKSIFRRRREAR